MWPFRSDPGRKAVKISSYDGYRKDPHIIQPPIRLDGSHAAVKLTKKPHLSSS
jgi:hypothetical protein